MPRGWKEGEVSVTPVVRLTHRDRGDTVRRHAHVLGPAVPLFGTWLMLWLLYWVFAVPVVLALAVGRTTVWVLMGRPHRRGTTLTLAGRPKL